MKLAKLIIPPATPTSLLSLLGIPDGQRGTVDVLFQAPTTNTADIKLGTAAEQPGFIAAGGSATLENLNLKTTFVSGNGINTLAVLVIR